MTTAEELAMVRSAIHELENGKMVVSYSIDGVSVQYSVAQLPFLVEREKELARRLMMREVRKRTYPRW